MKKVRSSTVIKPAKELKDFYYTITPLDKEAIDRTLKKLIEQLEVLVKHSSSTMTSKEFGNVSVDQAAYITYRLSELGYFVHFEHDENNISKLFISLHPIIINSRKDSEVERLDRIIGEFRNTTDALEIENKKLKEEVDDLRYRNGALGRQVNDLKALKAGAESQNEDLLNIVLQLVNKM